MKKLTSLLILCAMLASFASCAADTSDISDTTAAETEAETTVTETEPPEYEIPDVDLSGKTFKFSSLQQPNPNWIARHYVEASRPELNGDIINDAIYERIAKTEEDLGVKIESVIYDNASTAVNSTMAGDHYADCLLINENIKTLLTQNMLTDLYTIDTLDLDRSWWNHNSIEQLSIGGKLFMAAGDISPVGILAAYSTFVNKGLLEDYGLDNPYDYVRDGTWTWDKMEQMGRTVAKDVNGDGNMTEEDVFGFSSELSGFQTLGSCGVIYTVKDEDDYPVLTMDPELCATAIEKFVPLFRDNTVSLFAQDYNGKGYTNVFRQVITQKFIEDTLLFINNWLVVALELRNMESDFGILPPPKLSEAQEKHTIYHAEIWSTYATVPVTATDLDTVGYVMNSLGYYGHEEIYTALIETTITSKTLRDTDTEEMLDIIYNSRIFELAGLYNWGSMSNMINSLISSKSTNFASAYASYESQIKAAIEDTISNLE